MLLDAGADTALRNNEGSTPLILAAFKGHESVVQLLIARGADLNLRDAVRSRRDAQLAQRDSLTARAAQIGTTALAMAARKHHAGVVQLLLVAGADPNISNKVAARALSLFGSLTLTHLPRRSAARRRSWWR
jgi:ankyrin repeat protein